MRSYYPGKQSKQGNKRSTLSMAGKMSFQSSFIPRKHDVEPVKEVMEKGGGDILDEKIKKITKNTLKKSLPKNSNPIVISEKDLNSYVDKIIVDNGGVPSEVANKVKGDVGSIKSDYIGKRLSNLKYDVSSSLDEYMKKFNDEKEEEKRQNILKKEYSANRMAELFNKFSKKNDQKSGFDALKSNAEKQRAKEEREREISMMNNERNMLVEKIIKSAENEWYSKKIYKEAVDFNTRKAVFVGGRLSDMIEKVKENSTDEVETITEVLNYASNKYRLDFVVANYDAVKTEFESKETYIEYAEAHMENDLAALRKLNTLLKRNKNDISI